MNERAIFEAASEIQVPSRLRAYLDQACAGNPELRARIEGLLKSHETAGSFLDVPVVDQLQPGSSRPLDRTTDLSADAIANEDSEQDDDAQIALSFLQPSAKPDSIGKLAHYEVLQVLGQGGFGIVLKSFDEKLQRLVAIKVMSPQMAATSPPRKRFLREARAAAAIKHENVVQVYTVDEQPLPYLVMEYIDGQTLQQKLDRAGPLEVPEMLHLGRQIASGLAAAHAMGLIHLDIKPGNILLEQGSEQKVKITDFGLARAADDASMTRTGVVSGTPMYMAPEQALGQPLDHRADLFSFGSVLYQMACGRPPFRASTTVAVLRRVAEDSPRPLQEILPEIPDWLVAIVAKLHAKQPADRFQSAKEVAELFARCQSELKHRGRVESLGDVLLMVPRSASATEEPAPGARPKSEHRLTLAIDSPSPQPRSRRGIAAAAMILVLLGGLSLTEAAGVTNVLTSVIRLISPDGVLVVEVDDPGVSVSIDGEELVITGTGAKEIRLKPGQYKLLASKDGKLVRRELVTVTRKGRQVVRVSKEVDFVAADPDRRAAEWVLEVGGKVGLIVEDSQVQVRSRDQLPQRPFVLISIQLGYKPVTDANLQTLGGLSQLQVLELNNTNITGPGLHYLKGLPSLAVLDLSDTPITGQGFEHYQQLPNLKRLFLENTPLADGAMLNLRELHGLEWLILSGAHVTDRDVEQLKGLRGLDSLRLAKTQVTDASLKYVQSLPKLQLLDLSETTITDTGLQYLQGMTNLRLLELKATGVTAAGVDKLHTALPKCKIVSDHRTFESLADADRVAAEWVLKVGGTVQVFADGKEIPLHDIRDIEGKVFAVTQINVADNKLVDDAGLIALKGLKRLEVLHFSGTVVTDAGLEHLAGLNSLRVLGMVHIKATDAGLAHLKGLTELRSLQLSNPGITGAGLIHLQGMTRLEYMELQQTPLTGKALAHLKHLTSLRSLGFDGEGVTDEILSHLQGPAALQNLSLAHTKVTDAGLVHLKALPNLQSLHLYVTVVGDAGLEHLKGLNDLRELHIQQTQVTAGGVEKLRAALPKCKFVSDYGPFETNAD